MTYWRELKIEKDGVQELERKANDLLATAIQRYASSQVSEEPLLP